MGYDKILNIMIIQKQKNGQLMTIYGLGNIKFNIFCHRRPDRTFKFKGKYFPVCARCTGIYIGALFIFILHYFINLVYSLNLLFLSMILMFPTVIDGTAQLLKWRESRNDIRLVTGLLFGIGYGFILIYL